MSKRIRATEKHIAENDCECGDPGCPVHKGEQVCNLNATTQLFRIDMEDQTGTLMCDRCADDASESGLFTDETLNEDDDDLEEECDVVEHGHYE